MKLRTRIAVTTLLVAVPVLILVVWLRARFIEQAESDMVVRAIANYMQSGGRDACERSPATWQVLPTRPLPIPRQRHGQGDVPMPFPLPFVIADDANLRGMGTFAYDAQLAPSHALAPHIDDDLRARIARESPVVRHVDGTPSMREVLVRMPWEDGPCAFVFVRQPDVQSDESVLELIPLRVWAPVLLIVLVAVMFGVGPAVRRIRTLTKEVRSSASASYESQVTVRGRDEIADLARAFNDAGREIRARMAAQEQRERTLREFLDNTTHDVMTPLTVLQGHLTALAKHATPEQQPRVDSAMDEAHYIASLIHNLSLAAKLEAGEPAHRRESFDLSALIERVVARHLPIARNHGLSIEHALPERPLFAAGDVTFVEQAVSNLVLNAVQHVPPGGHVAVTLDELDAARFSLEILDDGPGMAADDIERLLERGRRGNEARTRAPHGRGLGLDIAQRVVRVHGWSLSLAAIDPHGLSVVIEGPLQKVSSSRESDSA